MEITYLGHSSFKLKGKDATVITDPFDKKVGFAYPSVTGDIVTSSHDHFDHASISAVKPTTKREKPFVISSPGEYEILGVSVFGYPSYHDDKQGAERGKNTIYAIVIDGITVVHLGDLGHTLDEHFIERLGTVDVLLCPVGGHFTIDDKTAVEIIQEIEPSYVIPMHYKTDAHDDKAFGELSTVADFEKEFGVTVEPVKSISMTLGSMPEQTTLVVLSN